MNTMQFFNGAVMALIGLIAPYAQGVNPSFIDIYKKGKEVLNAQVKAGLDPANIGKFIKMAGLKEQQIVEKEIAAYLIKHRGYRISQPSPFGSSLNGGTGLPRLYPRVSRQMQHAVFKISPYLLGAFLAEEKLRNAYSLSWQSTLSTAAPLGAGALAGWSYLAHNGFLDEAPLAALKARIKKSSMARLYALYNAGKKGYVQELINKVPLELQGSYVECNAAGIPLRIVRPTIGRYLRESRNYWQRSPSVWGSSLENGSGLPRLYPPLSKTIRQAFLRGSCGAFLGLTALSMIESAKKAMMGSHEDDEKDEWKTQNTFL